jgi:hypothetical protein
MMRSGTRPAPALAAADAQDAHASAANARTQARRVCMTLSDALFDSSRAESLDAQSTARNINVLRKIVAEHSLPRTFNNSWLRACAPKIVL